MTHTNGTTKLSAVIFSTLVSGTTPAWSEELYKDRYLLPPLKVELPPRQSADVGKLSFASNKTPNTSPAVTADPWAILAALEEGWDGANASSISPDAIANAKSFLQFIGYLGIDFTPFSDPDGSVGLEAEKPGKNALLLVDERGLFTYVIADGSEVHRGDNITARKMRDLLAHLY